MLISLIFLKRILKKKILFIVIIIYKYLLYGSGKIQHIIINIKLWVIIINCQLYKWLRFG